MSHFEKALNAEYAEYAKMRNAGVSHQEAMERLRIASASAVKTALAEILAEMPPAAERPTAPETPKITNE